MSRLMFASSRENAVTAVTLMLLGLAAASPLHAQPIATSASMTEGRVEFDFPSASSNRRSRPQSRHVGQSQRHRPSSN